MIGIAITAILLALVAGGLIVFWDKICKWIKKAVEKIKEVLGVTVEGVRTFIVRTREGFQNKAKYYNKNEITKEWEETIYMKKVDEAEVPPEILAKVRVKDIDIEVSTTEELKLVVKA